MISRSLGKSKVDISTSHKSWAIKKISTYQKILTIHFLNRETTQEENYFLLGNEISI